MKHNITYSIIIPCRNERNNLERLLPVLIRLYPKSRIFIVDDDSPDGTGNYVLGLAKKYQQIRLISRIGKRGRGSAVMDGLKEAIKDKGVSYFLEIDADFSHDPYEIAKFIRAASPDKLIIGSRHIHGGRFINCTPFRVVLSILANKYADLILKLGIHDYTNGFRLYPRTAVKQLLDEEIYEKGYIVLSETAYILHQKGFGIKEIPAIFTNRTIGRSNATILEFLRSIPAIIRIRLNHC